MLGDIVARAHVELAIGCRVDGLVRLIQLAQSAQERAAVTVSHARLEAVFLEEPDNVVGPAQARQCELIADAHRVPGSAAARQRPVGLYAKAGVPEQMLDRKLKPMEVSLVAVGRR